MMKCTQRLFEALLIALKANDLWAQYEDDDSIVEKLRAPFGPEFWPEELIFMADGQKQSSIEVRAGKGLDQDDADAYGGEFRWSTLDSYRLVASVLDALLIPEEHTRMFLYQGEVSIHAREDQIEIEGRIVTRGGQMSSRIMVADMVTSSGPTWTET